MEALQGATDTGAKLVQRYKQRAFLDCGPVPVDKKRSKRWDKTVRSLVVRHEKLAVTSRAYNIWMRSQRCDTTTRCTTAGGQRVRCVTGLKRKCPEEETDLFAGQPAVKQRTH